MSATLPTLSVDQIREKLNLCTQRVIRLQNELGNVESGSNQHRAVKKRWEEALSDQRIVKQMLRDASVDSRRQRLITGSVEAAKHFSAAASAMKRYVGEVNLLYERWSSGSLPASAEDCCAELAAVLEIDA